MSLINIIGNTISSGFVAVGATISDFLYYDPDPEFVNNASITNRGTSGTNAVGYSGKSYDFDGVSDFVDTGQTLSFARTDNFHCSAWIKVDVSGASQAIMTTRLDDGTSAGFLFYVRFTDKLSLLLIDTAGNQILVSSTNSVTLNKWLFVEGIYDGSSNQDGVTLKIDGVTETPVVITSGTLTANITGAENIHIGAEAYATKWLFFNGQISDCSITINGTLAHQFEFNQASSTGIFDSVQGVLATNSGCALIEGLSGLENGETHNGIPQSFSKNWNKYDEFNGTNNYVIANTSDFDNTGDNQVVEMDFIVNKVDATGYTIFSSRDDVFNVSSYVQVSSVANGLYLYCRGGGGFRSANTSLSIGDRVIATLTFNATAETCVLSGTINGTPFSINVSTFGSLVATNKLTIGATFTNAYIQFFDGVYFKLSINGTKYVTPNDYNSLGIEGTAPTKILIPENPASLGNDIFANAIIDPQPKFKLDGASYGDTGQTVSIDYNIPFTITANEVYIYDSTSNNAVFSNRDNTANQRGVLAYLDTSNRPVLLMQLNTTTRVQVQSNVAISNNDNVQWISDGTGDASGVTLKINAAAVATTTLQGQDISAGITSAANAYFGIDLDGTANELKGSTGIITLDL